MVIAMSENKEKDPPLLLKKWQLRLKLDKDKSLSKGDGAVFAQILDRFNPKVGYSYPSLNRLADDTGLSQRNAQRSIKKLVDASYIEIIQHGNRHNMANRYQPNFNLVDKVETPVSLVVETPMSIQGRDTHVSRVETPVSQSRDAHVARYGHGCLPNPSTNPSINEGEVDEENATLANPLRGSPLASKSKAKPEREYAEFWDVYVKRENVTDANKAIKEALENGVNYGEIVEGAKSYMAWIEHEGKEYRYIKQPFNFINKKSWLDDHEITPAKPPKTREKKKADNLSMVDKENNMSSEEIKALIDKKWDVFSDHAENCSTCNGYISFYESEHDTPFQFDFCEIGKPLLFEACKLNAMAENIKPDYNITKTQLIEERHKSELSYFYWNNHLREDELHNDIADNYHTILYASYHLFKSNEA
jgi:DNA-binding transcriptional regulator YhcF (GntR family)